VYYIFDLGKACFCLQIRNSKIRIAALLAEAEEKGSEYEEKVKFASVECVASIFIAFIC